MKKRNRWHLLLIIMFALFAADMVIDHCSGPDKVIIEQNIPSPQKGREAHIYDYYQGKWIYKDELPQGKKGWEGDNEEYTCKPQYKGLTEEELQEYLEDHIDGYKEKTYWGEEWDEPEEDY